MPSKCPFCGSPTLETRTGIYRFEPPQNIPGGTLQVPDAEWSECSRCGEIIHPPALCEAIQDMVSARRLRYRAAELAGKEPGWTDELLP